VVVFNLIGKRYWFFAFSALMLVPGTVVLIGSGVPKSIDFTGGAVFEVAFADPSKVTETGLYEVYAEHGVGDLRILVTTDEPVQHQMRSQEMTPSQKEAVSADLSTRFGEFDELRFDSIGPSVGAEVQSKAALAVAMTALGILIYLTIQFRGVPHPVRYGVCAIVAMVHDVLLVLGVAAILGATRGWEVDALFITAVLTVIGFSVHDSIVVFDRIRENVGRMRATRFEDVVNHSIIQTLDRSINTQLTAVFALSAIYLYSQGAIQRFVFWLVIGFIAGTYSSIFNAAPLLVVWENREWRRWFGRGRQSAAPIG
jgi:preprotein translocase subunit SecF